MKYLNIKVEKNYWYISEAMIVSDEPSSAEVRKKMIDHNKAAGRMILFGPFSTLRKPRTRVKN